MPNLREKKNFRLVTEHIKEINTIENNGDRVLREALVDIVNHKEDLFNLIRWKEIYEMLEEATDRDGRCRRRTAAGGYQKWLIRFCF